jgi:hypothetical protein
MALCFYVYVSLDARYYSVVDELQLNQYLVSPS